jgi:two-component system, OmpR family, sensor histidine kinase VicK
VITIMQTFSLLIWLLLGTNLTAVVLLIACASRQEPLRRVINAMPVIVFTTDRHGKCRLAEGSGLESVRMSAKDAVGKSVFEMFAHRPAITESARQVLEGKSMSLHQQMDGHDYITTAKPTDDRGMMGIILDVSEMSLNVTEPHYRAIIENVSDIVYMLDPDLRILFLNPAFTHVTGWEVNEWLGRSVYDLLRTDHPEQVREFVDAAANDPVQSVSSQIQIATRFGNEVLVEFKLQPYLKEDILAGFTGVARDISDRGRIALQELQMAMEHERLTALRRFLRHASHDLRTPLAVINSSGYLIRRKLKPEMLASVLPQVDMIERQVMHLNEQLNNLFKFSETQTRAGRHLFQKHQLPELVSQVIQEQTPAIQLKRHKIAFHTEGELPPVLVDAEDIQRVIRHLLVNAIRYTPEQGSISIEIKRDSLNILLQITDNGIGIPREELPLIFEPFYRVDRARNLDTGGLGLGLTISRAIIAAHEGYLQVESTLNEGTTAIVALPVATSE